MNRRRLLAGADAPAGPGISAAPASTVNGLPLPAAVSDAMKAGLSNGTVTLVHARLSAHMGGRKR